LEWRLGDSLGISDRGTKAKTITSCDNAFVTNILLLSLRFRAKNICCPETLQRSGCFLCESATTATTKRPVGTEINPSYGDQQIIKAHFSNSLIGKMSFIFYSTN